MRLKAWTEWWLTPADNSAKHERLAITICLSGLIIIVFMVTLTPVGIFYDEEAHLTSLAILRETGLSHQFLRHLPVSTGPLLPVIQLITSPITKGTLTGLRLLNLHLLLAVLFFCGCSLNIKINTMLGAMPQVCLQFHLCGLLAG